MLKISNLTVGYSRSLRPALNGVSLEVGTGEVVCVVGESGSGKSTLALACLRLLGSDVEIGGTIELDGRNIFSLSAAELRNVRGREIGFVNQDALSSFSAYWTVGEQIAETIEAHTNLPRRIAWERTLDQLASVRIDNPERIARSYPHELSGGQRQRAALAMGLALRPRILIADEPTSALDVTTASHLLALLRQLQREYSIGVLLITHDLRVVEAVADRVAVMYAGILGEVGARDEVLRRPRFPYTRALIDSLDLERARGSLKGVPGVPPGLSETLPGCPFAPRCTRAEDICQRMSPAPVTIGETVVRCHFPDSVEGVEVHVHSVG